MPEHALLNPILSFKRAPVPKSITGGGKNADSINGPMLGKQRSALSKKLEEISNSPRLDLVFGESTHLIARMQEDSLSPSWTPKDIFTEANSCEIICPAHEGFLVEVKTKNIELLAERIKSTQKTTELVDISRIKSIDLFDSAETLRGNDPSSIWNSSNNSKKSKAFNLWLKPFKSIASRRALAQKFKESVIETESSLGDPEFDAPTSSEGKESPLDRIVNQYISNGTASFSLEIKDKDSLDRIISSGAIYRIEPSTPLTTTCAPGQGREPLPNTIDPNSPVVVVIDGGVSARSYIPLQRLSIPPLIHDNYANKSHGNKVTSLVCHAHAWNKNRPLPDLDCTFIAAQAICKESAPKSPTNNQLINYLETIAKKTSQISRVWNLSFNQLKNSVTTPEVSYLGHQISRIAREFNILPIISIGNSSHNNISKLLCPPADCEAALTIGSREFIDNKNPLGGASSFSLQGPAPAGMKKPELSWYGSLRMLGGSIDHGTSFSTPLVSSLAAHTFANLKISSPDLVRAILINRADLHEHSSSLGWGTPLIEDELPWHCPQGAVTMVWISKLKPGFDYYWNDIPIPDEMMKNGKLKGTIALTAILKPITSEPAGQNYFATRLQTSLQASSKSGATISLAGSMKESKEKEAVAREELSKWSPVRHHVQTHKSKYIEPKSVRLYARVFTRDLYQFSVEHHSELDEQEVAFVLTMKSSDNSRSIYSSMISKLNTDVEVALIDQAIHVSSEN